MRIGERQYGREELLRYIGGIHQLGGTRHLQFTQGRAKGTAAIAFNTGAGLCFTVLPDRGLDLYDATYKGVNLVYHTPSGVAHPSYYDPHGSEWSRVFCAGLLTTCGLTYFGAPGRDGREDLGLHGRYSATPAVQVRDDSGWRGDEYQLEVKGVIEDCPPFGDKIRLTRVITSAIGAKSLRIHDTIENFGYRRSPFTILYHVNCGFPLLDQDSELVLSSLKREPYDDPSRADLGDYGKFAVPTAEYAERNFLHEMAGDEQGTALAGLVNAKLGDGLALYLKFPTAQLPFLSQWKMLGEGEYVTGLEPCNAKCENRAKLRERGALPYLEPGGIVEIEMEIGVLEGRSEIDAFAAQVREVLAGGRV